MDGVMVEVWTDPDLTRAAKDILLALQETNAMVSHLYAAALFVIGTVSAVFVCRLLYKALKTLV